MSTTKRKQELINSISEKIRTRKEIEKQQQQEQQRRTKRQQEMIDEIKEYFSVLPIYNYNVDKSDDFAYMVIDITKQPDRPRPDVYMHVREFLTAAPKSLDDMDEIQYYDHVEKIYNNREKILEKIQEGL